MSCSKEEMILSKAFLFAIAALVHSSHQRASTGRSFSSDDDRPWDDFGDYSDDVQVDELLWDDGRHRHIYLDADGNWVHRDFDYEQGPTSDGDFDSEPRSLLDENEYSGESYVPESEPSSDDSDQESEHRQSESLCMHLDANGNWEYVDCHHKRETLENNWANRREDSEADWDREYSKIGDELNQEDIDR